MGGVDLSGYEKPSTRQEQVLRLKHEISITRDTVERMEKSAKCKTKLSPNEHDMAVTE